MNHPRFSSAFSCFIYVLSVTPAMFSSLFIVLLLSLFLLYSSICFSVYNSPRNVRILFLQYGHFLARFGFGFSTLIAIWTSCLAYAFYKFQHSFLPSIFLHFRYLFMATPHKPIHHYHHLTCTHPHSPRIHNAQNTLAPGCVYQNQHNPNPDRCRNRN